MEAAAAALKEAFYELTATRARLEEDLVGLFDILVFDRMFIAAGSRFCCRALLPALLR